MPPGNRNIPGLQYATGFLIIFFLWLDTSSMGCLKQTLSRDSLYRTCLCALQRESGGGCVNYCTSEDSVLYLCMSAVWSLFSSDKYTGSFSLQESCKHSSKHQAQHRGWVVNGPEDYICFPVPYPTIPMLICCDIHIWSLPAGGVPLVGKSV